MLQKQIPKAEWKEIELGEICEIKKGKSITKNTVTKGNIPVIAGGQQPAYYHNVFNRTGETITVSGSGAYAGFLAYFDTPLFASDCSTIQKKSEGVFMKYIYYFLKGSQNKIYKLQKGIAQPHVYPKDLAIIRIPLPPLQVQKQIVFILEKAEALKQKGKKTEDLFDEYLKSVFWEMFLKENKKYRKVTINETAINKKGAIRMGPFGSQLKKNELVDSGVRVLWIENIVNNKFEYSDEKFITPEKFKQLSGFEVYPNNILITMMGTIGRVAIVPREIDKSIISSHLLKIEVNHDRFNSVFLKYLLLTPFVQKQWKKHSHGIVMSGLNTGIIKEAEIFEPPLPLQQKFAKIVEHVEGLKEKIKKTKQNSEELFNSLMSKAFRGEL